VSDASVHAALRSNHPLVLVEAPAGCGKTYQGADYARELVKSTTRGRPLILTHTHAACSVFAERTSGHRNAIEIKTIDGMIARIATAYHKGLGLPADTSSWVRRREDGHAKLAVKVSGLLKRYPMIASSLVHRHPFVICDEYQDSSGDQHALVMAMLERGAKVRVFADPMQKIFRDKTIDGSCPPCDWNDLKKIAEASEELDAPHRWEDDSPALGAWTLAARKTLGNGGAIDLKAAPPAGLHVVFAENHAKKYGDYALDKPDRKPVDLFVASQHSLLVLTRLNQTAKAFRGFFDRRISLWEGHVRVGLERLVNDIAAAEGDCGKLGSAIVRFVDDIERGFSPSAFSNAFKREIREGCAKPRKGKPAAIQELAQCVLKAPNHHGVAVMLRRLAERKTSDPAFSEIEFDNYREFKDAIRLGDFADLESGLTEITHHRTYARPKPPAKAISTIHKAKGLECNGVLVMPCDAKTFPDKADARCLLYVALSRPKKRLMLVLSRDNPSPLFKI
jgi:DNA helicase-2/ATP-dependent DNA helicase PcrA